MLLPLLTLLLATATPSTAPQPAVLTVAVADQPRRVLGLAGATNFRDLGGYATADGRHVRWGVVYRSNKLSALTPADLAQVDTLGIRSEVDFRTLEERKAEPSRWLHRPADIYESDKATIAPVTHMILANAGTVQTARDGVIAFYTRMPDMYRPEYAALFKRLAAGEEPLVMHCTAGKDRTGVASALLLSALGVPRETVVADYALTARLLPMPPAAAPAGGAGITGFSALPGDVRAVMWNADPGYITAALDAVTREYGSVDGYMKQGLGLGDTEIAALRSRLTE